MPTHLDTRHEEIEALWPGIEAYQQLAEAYGIRDIFQDAGGKMLQLAIATGIDLSTERMGPDGFDRSGGEYEIKTLDTSRGNSGYSTNHHLGHGTIARYRNRRWVFAVYEGITLKEAYRLEAELLEPFFAAWTRQINATANGYLNNPKVPLAYVRSHGTVMYLKDVPPAWARPAADAA